MPELPDIAVYLDCLAPRIVGQPLERLTIRNPFVLRSVSPSPAEMAGSRVEGLRRMGNGSCWPWSASGSSSST